MVSLCDTETMAAQTKRRLHREPLIVKARQDLPRHRWIINISEAPDRSRSGTPSDHIDLDQRAAREAGYPNAGARR